MLKELHIENIAVIEKTDIEFREGLNILTGETGAGKSIIIDSIGAVLGSRASHNLVRYGTDKGVVTAVFSNDNAAAWLEENDIEADDDLIIQRKLTSDGKTSCRVNGCPVTVAQLKTLGSLLIDVHGQNDGAKLLDEKNHLTYLDSFACLSAQRSEYSAAFSDYRAVLKELKSFDVDEAEKARKIELIQARTEELKNAGIRPGEKDEISDRLTLLRNFEKLSDYVNSAYDCIYSGNENALNFAEEAENCLEKASDISDQLTKIYESVRDSVILLSDAADELRDFRDSLDFSEEEYNNLEERLHFINRLERKYNMSSDDFEEYIESLEAELQKFENADEMKIALVRSCNDAKAKCTVLAKALSSIRKKSALSLEKEISKQLRELNMPSAVFKVEIGKVENTDGFDSGGCDVVRFLLSANSGTEPDRISRIASGGELSRIMLAMKNVFAANDAVPVMIFDEIDTGVSGVAAQRVGEKLCCVSAGKQVLCITHLPQIAAMADNHYLIEKKEINGKTYTRVQQLDFRGRQYELARLYGGDNISEITLAGAAEQLKAAQNTKNRLNQ